MIDRIRQDIQERLDQLLAEADQLRQALSALGGEQSQRSSRASRGSATSRSRTRSASTSRARSTPTATRTRSRSRSTGSRGGAGGTKNSVLKALSDASGEAMTASEVASKTGLGRASVSTTLSKLAKSGEVTKAQRGYRLSGSGASSGAASAAQS